MIAEGYRVYWQYNEDVQGVMCYILHIKDNTVTVGNAWTAKGDRFCKETGRKLSMKRALLKAFPKSNSIGINTANYHWRCKFWETYRTMTKKPRWSFKTGFRY